MSACAEPRLLPVRRVAAVCSCCKVSLCSEEGRKEGGGKNDRSLFALLASSVELESRSPALCLFFFPSPRCRPRSPLLPCGLAGAFHRGLDRRRKKRKRGGPTGCSCSSAAAAPPLESRRSAWTGMGRAAPFCAIAARAEQQQQQRRRNRLRPPPLPALAVLFSLGLLLNTGTTDVPIGAPFLVGRAGSVFGSLVKLGGGEGRVTPRPQ